MKSASREAKGYEGAERVEEIAIRVQGQPARAFVGGRGEPLLLVHGGWGGASMHWEPVWDRLAQRFRVIAPDLPGIGSGDQPGLGSVAAYARWLRSLLEALDVTGAWCVGNSFGASVVARFASDYPDRCLGLVFVNGFPMPRSPKIFQWLGERRFGRRLVRAVERRVAYTPGVVERAFFDATHAPEELRRVISQPSPPQLDALTDVLVHGGGERVTPRVLPLLLWGEEDHLPGTSARSARKLRASWPGAQLAFVPRAGHLPQVENPAVFAEQLGAFVTRARAERARAAVH